MQRFFFEDQLQQHSKKCKKASSFRNISDGEFDTHKYSSRDALEGEQRSSKLMQIFCALLLVFNEEKESRKIFLLLRIFLEKLEVI